MPRKILTHEERIAARKATMRRYYIKNKEKIRERTDAWKNKNRERANELLRNWRKNNKERFEASTREWIEKNPDRLKENAKRYREKNKDRLMAAHRQWLKANPHLVNAYSGKRRIGTKFHALSNPKLIADIYKATHAASRSTGIKHSTDHIIPISFGGAHHEGNLQSLPKSINESKHNNPFWLSPSPEYKDWRDVPRELWPLDLAPKYLELIEMNRGVSIRWDTAA